MPQPQRYNLEGMVFGNWTVESYAGDYKWLSRCGCGVVKTVRSDKLRNGTSTSCGCLRKNRLTHGLSGTPEHMAWRSMRYRCENPNNESYKDYGERGITVCERWSSFDNFFEDMGPRPSSKHSIEREDVNGNYDPDNCVWATITEQNRNTRKTCFVTYNGEIYKLVELAEEIEISPRTLRKRCVRGSHGMAFAR